MKYIRTKDGHIYEIETIEFGGIRKGCFKNASDYFNLYNSLREWQLDCKKQYCLDTPNGYTTCINQADTIEELCDEFVRIAGNNRHDVIDLELGKQYKTAYPNIKVYGSIWTDKGLIYVAKMNEKGELELL